MEEDLQKNKKRGLIVLDDKISTYGSLDVKMKDLPLSEEAKDNFFASMCREEFLSSGPKVVGIKNSGYTF